jgi:arginyl-tRNA synthetase
MQLGKKLKQDPFYVAEKIAQYIEIKEPIEQVKIIRPGFINIYLSKKYLTSQLKTIVTNEQYGNSDILKGKKIMCEFTDPNPFKEMHIGHLYSNTIGESLSRLLLSQGADLKRVNYQGDVGMHVAKSIWGLKHMMDADKLSIEDLEKKPLSARVKYLGQAYAKGATAYEENEEATQDMKDINYLVYAAAQEILIKLQNWEPQVDYKKFIKSSKWNLEEVKALYVVGRRWSLDYFETIYKKLGTKFDYYYFESIVGEFGTKIVKEYLKK